MRFLVTGATGFIGSHMAELLLARGWEVVCPVRNTALLRNLAGFRAEIVPLASIEEQVRKGPGIDYVIHIAGATRAPDYETYKYANVEFTRRLLDLFTNTESDRTLKRFVLISSQAASGPSADDGSPTCESDVPRPISLYGRSKLEAEELVHSFGMTVPVTIVRPPTVFGPRDVDVLGVFRSARFRIAPFLAGPDRLVSIVYVGDLVEGILQATLSPAAQGQTYFMANPRPVVWREFALQVARVLKYRAYPLPIPLGLTKLISLAGDSVMRWTGNTPLFRSEKLEEMKRIAWVCSAEKALKELNWQAGTPLEDDIHATATWYRNHGWI